MTFTQDHSTAKAGDDLPGLSFCFRAAQHRGRENGMHDPTRRTLLTRCAGIGATLLLPGLAVAQSTTSTPAARPPAPPPIDLVDVKAFVRDAHNDLAKTCAHLDRVPTLLNAAWDWGGGDYETAIGAAGHMGRRDIAEFLVERGARVDIFVAAMLGQTDVVRATLTALPALARSKGPHGISLMRHARAGGDPALKVVDYLRSLGLD